MPLSSLQIIEQHRHQLCSGGSNPYSIKEVGTCPKHGNLCRDDLDERRRKASPQSRETSDSLGYVPHAVHLVQRAAVDNASSMCCSAKDMPGSGFS